MYRYRYDARYVPLQVQNDFELLLTKTSRLWTSRAATPRKIKTGLAEKAISPCGLVPKANQRRYTMHRKNPQAAKLTAVYESLTASIRLLAKTHPETLDYVAMPMADLENLVNEANGHQLDPMENLIKPARTH